MKTTATKNMDRIFIQIHLSLTSLLYTILQQKIILKNLVGASPIYFTYFIITYYVLYFFMYTANFFHIGSSINYSNVKSGVINFDLRFKVSSCILLAKAA